MDKHCAELLLDLKLHGTPDPLRKKRPFSEDISSAHGVLFNPRYTKLRKVKAYRKWIESGQPCVFGRVAAKNENIFICPLDESEILRMRRGDADLKDTIQDYRQVWKRYALEGLSSSFLILLIAPSVVTSAPGPELKELCRRLMELYLELPRIEDDTYHVQREYLFLRSASGDSSKIIKFSTLPNVFCAQGDGRWWHDHRTPGGVMITSNALGHFVYSRSSTRTMTEKDKIVALENAMRTINNAFRPTRKNSGLKHCPATALVSRPPEEPTPISDKSEFSRYSASRYRGFFHTDHLIPSVFFHPDRDPENLPEYNALELNYIHDASGDAEGHAELMTGTPSTWYEVQRNLDRLPSFANGESGGPLTPKLRGRLLQWLEQRLQERLI